MTSYKKKKVGILYLWEGGVLWVPAPTLRMAASLLFNINELPASFRGAGGGKCPEEEHTTCSGGPRMKFSQARFMGRRKIKYFKKRNKIFYEKIE
jgi:hypothetical protein